MAAADLTPLQQAERIRGMLDLGFEEEEIRDKHPELVAGWDHLTEVALSSPAAAGPMHGSAVVPL